MEGSRSKDARDLGFGHSTSLPALLPQQEPPSLSPHPINPKPAWSQQQLPPRARLQLWFIRVCSGILLWTCVVQLLTVGQIWHRPHLSSVGGIWDPHRLFGEITGRIAQFSMENQAPTPAPPSLLPARVYKSNGFLKVSCNGGLNQMRAAICDMVMIARFLNLTLVIPELDKKSFWADPSNFRDIFDVRHFTDSLRDEVHIISRLPKRLIKNGANVTFSMPPVSWSNENYYLKQILPLFSKYEVVHFNKTDARLANNGISIELQKLRCRVNYHALKFTDQIETLGNKLIQVLRAKGRFVALHLRYEMDMLAFSGCTHGCSKEEAELLKTMRDLSIWLAAKDPKLLSDKKFHRNQICKNIQMCRRLKSHRRFHLSLEAFKACMNNIFLCLVDNLIVGPQPAGEASAEGAASVANSEPAEIVPMGTETFPPHGIEWPSGTQITPMASSFSFKSLLLTGLEEVFHRDPPSHWKK